MTYEVEQKFPATDLDALRRRIDRLGGKLSPPQQQVDAYFGHPARDFGQTDEALRIRRVGERSRVTYKGPKIDKTTKTRRELEFDLTDGDKFAELLAALSFRPVATVRKQRRTAELQWQGQEAEVAIDDVDHVGQFVEIELSAEEASLDAARETLHALAAELGLEQPERRSYLEMLLERGRT